MVREYRHADGNCSTMQLCRSTQRVEPSNIAEVPWWNIHRGFVGLADRVLVGGASLCLR
jgi:hypothetical protein